MRFFILLCASLGLLACEKKDSRSSAPQESCVGDTILPQLQLTFAVQPAKLDQELTLHLQGRIINISDGPDLTFLDRDITFTEVPASFEVNDLKESALGQPLAQVNWKAVVKSGNFVISKETVSSDCKRLTWAFDLMKTGAP